MLYQRSNKSIVSAALCWGGFWTATGSGFWLTGGLITEGGFSYYWFEPLEPFEPEDFCDGGFLISGFYFSYS